MSTQADLDELAQRYLDLWQDQMTALAGDKDFAAALQQLMTAMGLTGAGLPAAWSNWPAMAAGLTAGAGGGTTADGQGQSPAGEPGSAVGAGAAPGAAAVAAASGGGGVDLDQLARRLAALEERIAALEAGIPGRGRRAPAKSKRR